MPNTDRCLCNNPQRVINSVFLPVKTLIENIVDIDNSHKITDNLCKKYQFTHRTFPFRSMINQSIELFSKSNVATCKLSAFTSICW